MLLPEAACLPAGLPVLPAPTYLSGKDESPCTLSSPNLRPAGSSGPLSTPAPSVSSATASKPTRTPACSAVYSQLCYELARDIEEQDFPWDDDGVKQLQSWLQSRYEAYCAAHSA